MVKAAWLKTRHHPSAKLPLSPTIEFLVSLVLRWPYSPFHAGVL